MAGVEAGVLAGIMVGVLAGIMVGVLEGIVVGVMAGVEAGVLAGIVVGVLESWQVSRQVSKQVSRSLIGASCCTASHGKAARKAVRRSADTARLTISKYRRDRRRITIGKGLMLKSRCDGGRVVLMFLLMHIKMWRGGISRVSARQGRLETLQCNRNYLLEFYADGRSETARSVSFFCCNKKNYVL